MTPISKTNTVDRILDAAVNFVLCRGFRTVSVDQIIEMAAVSKGPFFYPFASKEILTLKMLERFNRRAA